MDLLELLRKEKRDIAPVLSILTQKDKLLKVDFSINNPEITSINIDNIAVFAMYLSKILKNAGKEMAYGGYLEQRHFYKRSKIFKNGNEIRDIHLGIDLWVFTPQPVFAPLDGIVHSLAINPGNGDYGGTIILQHSIQDITFYTLYGHLSHQSVNSLHKGQRIVAGQQIGTLGEPHENGYWSPHLHFQLIKDMLKYEGDFPGTCSASNLNYYKIICPDPAVLLGLE